MNKGNNGYFDNTGNSAIAERLITFLTSNVDMILILLLFFSFYSSKTNQYFQIKLSHLWKIRLTMEVRIQFNTKYYIKKLFNYLIY